MTINCDDILIMDASGLIENCEIISNINKYKWRAGTEVECDTKGL